MVNFHQKLLGQLDLIRKENKTINSILHLNPNAEKEAIALDKRIKEGQKPGLLAGMTFVIKSNINVSGLPLTCASKTLEGYESVYDADVIRRLRQEDAIIVGMANMDEFACGSSGESSAFGPTENPNAPGHITGGSSSGSAASVAAGFCDSALGSDTGGSIRNPASHCGVVGIKPSYGRVSRYGLVDLAMTLDQIGPISRDVRTAATVLEAISGPSEYDAMTSNKNPEQYSRYLEDDIKGLRIGIDRSMEKLCTDKRLWQKSIDFAQRLQDEKKAEIVNVSLPSLALAVMTYYPLVYVEFFSGTRKFDGRKYGKKIEDSCGEEVLRRILGGFEISKQEHKGRYYRAALNIRAMIKTEFEHAFNNADVILSPITPKLPHKIKEKITDPRELYAYDAFTTPANLSGICAGSVPYGKISGLPVGLQIQAPAFHEKRLLNVMWHVENMVK